MQKYLVITIDVEPDCSPNWQYSKPLTFHGIDTGIGKRLQPLFNKYDAKPTYLLNNVVMEDKASVQFLKKLSGRFELGTHLHPEFIGPEKQFFDYAGKRGKANCCQYKPKVEFKKLENITRMFEQNFNCKPTSFRAGRFAAGKNTIESLIRLGYKADTSVTPHVRWTDHGKLRANFKNAPEQPYFVDGSSIIDENPEGPLLQVPVSIVPHKFSLTKLIRRCFQKKKLSRLPPVWLRPAYSDIKGFAWVLDTLTRKYATSSTIVYNVMFHNVEVLPNLNPYTRDEAACTRFIQSLDWLLSYCKKNHIEVVGLSDLFSVYRPENHSQKLKVIKKNMETATQIVKGTLNSAVTTLILFFAHKINNLLLKAQTIASEMNGAFEQCQFI